MKLFVLNLLSSSSGTASGGTADNGWLSWVLIGVLVVAFAVMMIISSRSNKKRQQEQEAAINAIRAIRPGNKVKTIGGVCGIVVEVNDEDNTFVIETGNELNGKCYLKFDKAAIYQTDAKPAPTDDKKDDKKDDKEEKAENVENAELPAPAEAADGAETKPEEK